MLDEKGLKLRSFMCATITHARTHANGQDKKPAGAGH